MKNFKDFKTITEAVKLTPAELNKPNSITKEPRIDILIRLIQQNKPIELAKGGYVTVESTPELIQLLKILKTTIQVKKQRYHLWELYGKNYTTF